MAVGFRAGLVAALAWLAAANASADVLYLENGGRIQGRVLSHDDATISVDIGPGVIGLPASSVARIEPGRTVLDDYEQRLSAARVGNADDWLALARWASGHGLHPQATHAYKKVLAIDAGNPDANRAMGRVEFDGHWVSKAEAYRASGYVRFAGQWVTPAEKAALEQQRDERAAADQAIADARRAEARARAAEARARAAEAEARAREAEYYNGVPLFWAGIRPGRPGKPIVPDRPRPEPEPLPTRPVPRSVER